jgi:hypothetical protein
MRRVFTHILVSILTFAVGIGLVLLWRGILDSHISRLASEGINSKSTISDNKVNNGRRVLYDARNYVESEWSDERLRAAGEAEAAASRRVLPEVFRGGYLRNYGECSAFSTARMAQSPSELERVRARAQFNPDLAGWHTGNFTGADADEILYEVHVGECNAQSGPLAGGSDQLVIYGGGVLRASINTLLGDLKDDRMHDTDGDGVHEVLLGRTEIKGLSFVTTMRLVSLKGGEPRVIHDFGPAYIISCVDQFCRDPVIITPVITYTPGVGGNSPEFQVSFYRATCRKSEGCKFWPPADAWEYFSSGSLNKPVAR